MFYFSYKCVKIISLIGAYNDRRKSNLKNPYRKEKTTL